MTIVYAHKITAGEPSAADPSVTHLTLQSGGVDVDSAYVEAHSPQVGGFYTQELNAQGELVAGYAASITVGQAA